ncbi:helix-turn-helix transcriptional regulator [Myxococcota bacterium]|nr:helix-turn-helix transcriptional regulator [Myxococcota bacterium]
MTNRSYDSIRLLLLDSPSHVTLLRREIGLSLYALAQISGVPEPVLSQVERGVRDELSSERINALARAVAASPCPHCAGTGRVGAPQIEPAPSPAAAPAPVTPAPRLEAPAPAIAAPAADEVPAPAAPEPAAAPVAAARPAEATPAAAGSSGRPASFAEAMERLDEARRNGAIGAVIVEIRRQTGENRRAFAVRAGVPAHALVDLERGKSRSTSQLNTERIATAWIQGPSRAPSGGSTGSGSGSWTDDDDLLEDPDAGPSRAPRAATPRAASRSPAAPPPPAEEEDGEEGALQRQIFETLRTAVGAGNIGSELRRIRRRLNLPQQLLARRAGVEPKLVRDLESGARTRPGESALRALAKVLADEMGPHGSRTRRRARP